ncbi:hypothetical protein AGLY_004548 [Aphis glycines]|uniref:Uncharacterized protein n=1 Tax=Aphis glycines TaxID=307491 RepID=A0A6G0U0Q5_APHGL|nr:hypothetical protein AGLY_004548 [Aphis glycines]
MSFNSSPRLAVLSKSFSKRVITSFNLTSIFLASLGLLELIINSCVECATLSTLALCVSISDCNNLYSRICSDKRSVCKLTGLRHLTNEVMNPKHLVHHVIELMQCPIVIVGRLNHYIKIYTYLPIPLGSASLSHALTTFKASLYSLCLELSPLSLSDKALALAMTLITVFLITLSCDDTDGKPVLKSFKQVRYSLDSSMNFWAAIVIKRRSA